MMRTVGYYLQRLADELDGQGDKNELRRFGLILFDYLRGYSRAKLMLANDYLLTTNEIEFLEDAIKRLKEFEPIQYIVGRVDFMGSSFMVDKSVLIPRPETEELVTWILEEYSGHECRVLDIGTGSGCIAITIKKRWPEARVEAWDVSPDAIEVASRNAKENQASVVFNQVDVLKAKACGFKYDIIVSNPPYVTEEDRQGMSKNVLMYEPHLALFPGKDNPLVFYESIAAFAKRSLAEGGRVYFEINEAFGMQVALILKNSGFSDITVREDLYARDRMVRATWPGV